MIILNWNLIGSVYLDMKISILTILLQEGKNAPRTTNPFNAPPEEPRILIEAFKGTEGIYLSLTLYLL